MLPDPSLVMPANYSSLVVHVCHHSQQLVDNSSHRAK